MTDIAVFAGWLAFSVAALCLAFESHQKPAWGLALVVFGVNFGGFALLLGLIAWLTP